MLQVVRGRPVGYAPPWESRIRNAEFRCSIRSHVLTRSAVAGSMRVENRPPHGDLRPPDLRIVVAGSLTPAEEWLGR